MKEYLCWSLRQLYLIFFWPTQFGREVEGEEADLPKLKFSERFLYLLKILPWVIILAVLGNLILGYACEAYGVTFDWKSAWVSVAFGVAVGMASGVAFGVTFGVTFGVALGVAFSVAGGVTGGMTGGVVLGVAVGVTFGVALGVAFSVAGGVTGGMTGGVAFGVVLGVAFGVSFGVAFSVAFGVAFGVAFPLAFWLTYSRLITYPFDVVLTAATYYVGRQRLHAVWRAWRWCPVAWNEVIWLPLPFVSRLLALLVRQDREEGFRQIAFVAAERKLQRRAALAALVEVAVNDLRAGSLASLSDVMERLNWTTDAPAELPDELTAMLPRFDRAAQHVGQYLTLNSPYRKGEALAQAVAETEALQSSLIVARGRYAPRLLRVANEWRRLLDTESEKAKALAAATREIPNPFVFGNPVMETEQNVFTGRRDIVRQIEASVLGTTQTPTLLLHGPRRMGKTSILNQLPRVLGPDFAPTVVDCQNPALIESAAALLRYVARSLSQGLQRRRVTVAPLTAAALAREPFAVFDEWLDNVEQAMPQGMRALLCLDEYERLQATLDVGWGGSFLDALRHTLQHRPRVVLMFTGAHTFQELGPAWTDRFISARRVRVSFLTRAEVLPLLTQPIPEFDMTYAAGALDALFAATAGQPFLTQATAFELVQLLNEQERREATTADVETAIARALVSGGEYFANVWSDAGAEGQAILRAIVRAELPPDFPGARVWLREHDVLDDAGAFAVPMVRRWVQEKVRG
ncbi:MAG: ATP-binding protein [Pyrinomonadaceae bacterium]